MIDGSESDDSEFVSIGSGVIIPSRDKDNILVATNCHVIDTNPADAYAIKQGSDFGLAWVEGRNAEHDLCLLRAAVLPDYLSEDEEVRFKKLPAVQIGSSQSLEVGDTVYAVGAPRGLELSLSNGLVAGFRGHKGSEYIQTTAPISKGSSGGGLFDAQARLVGITTMYVKDGQALNFSVPAELIASVPNIARKSSSRPFPQPRSVAARAAADAAAEAADTPALETKKNSMDRWRTVYEDDEEVIAFDTQTVSKKGEVVTVWKRTRYVKPQRTPSGKIYSESISRTTFVCGQRQTSFDQLTVRDSAGQIVYDRKRKSWEIELSDVMPDTVGEVMYEAACGL